MKEYYLILEKGLVKKSIYPLSGSVTVGRGPENDINIIDWEVSRTHARISFQQDTWIIEDLGSANGIIFAGERVETKLLDPEDAFEIGGSTFRFVEHEPSVKTEQFFETMKAFAAAIRYQSDLLDRCRTESGSERMKDALLLTPILKSLNDMELIGVAGISNMHLFSAGQMIVREGDPGRSLFIILDGRVKVSIKDHGGNEFELATLKANQFFGEMAFLTGEPRSSTVTTLEECLLGEVSYSSMRKLVVRFPQIKDVLLEYFHERVEDSKKKRSEAGIENRRRYVRLSERLLAKFTVLPEPDSPEEMLNHTYWGTTEDISVYGALLEVKGPAMDAFSPGCELELKIELSSEEDKISTQATVRHIKRSEHTTKLGIEFSGISPEDKERLNDFMCGQDHIR